MLVAIGFVILASVSLTVVINGLRKAPEGYEHENGFHITSCNYSTHKRDKRSGDQGQANQCNDGVNIGDVVIPMWILLGDTTGNGSVHASDAASVKSKSGTAFTFGPGSLADIETPHLQYELSR